MIKKFRKKPVIIEAIQYEGNNKKEIIHFVGNNAFCPTCMDYISLTTLEGKMKVNVNDWVIKGVKGEFYPCKPDIFEETYEEVKKS